MATQILPSWRYAWRMHRFRPARQLVNLSGVLVGWTANLLPGLAARYFFDHLGRRGLWWLDWPLILLGSSALAQAVVAFTLQATNGAFAFANAGMLQRNMLWRVLQLPGGRGLPSSPGEAISRFRDDTEAVVWYPIQFNNVIGSLVALGVALTVMASINLVITVAVVTPLLMVVGIVEASRRRIITYRQANRERTSEVTGFIADVFTSVQSIQVAGAESRAVEHLRTLNGRRRQAAVRESLLMALLQGAFWMVNLGTGLVLIVAGRALANGGFSVGDLALFVYYLTVFQRFNEDLGQGLAGYQQLGVSFDRMQALMAGRPPGELVAGDDIYERGPLPSARPRRVESPPLVDLEMVYLTYRHPDGGGIANVSLRLRAGSFTVVVGRVGSGKTTLLQSVLGLVPATGRIRWNGNDIDPGAFMIPPNAAYTPQVPQLFSETLRDNVLLGADLDPDEALRLAVMEPDLLDMPQGLETRIGSRGVRLSGGQIQRTAAARMFVRRAQLLVCDDLSSALDVDTEADLWRRVASIQGQTVLAVSHRRGVLARADQVVVLRDGLVEAVGPVRQLLEECEEMRRLWRYEALTGDGAVPGRTATTESP